MSRHWIFKDATAALLLLSLSGDTTIAQEAPAPTGGGARLPGTTGATPGEPAVRERTEVVTLDVTVTDREHRLVSGLGPHDFEIFEEKVPQRIEYFRPADAPASVGVVFDVSGSMRGLLGRVFSPFPLRDRMCQGRLLRPNGGCPRTPEVYVIRFGDFFPERGARSGPSCHSTESSEGGNMASHTDPVCGMQVSERDAAGRSDHQGETYYFCSQGCKSKFDQNPGQYARKTTETQGGGTPR